MTTHRWIPAEERKPDNVRDVLLRIEVNMCWQYRVGWWNRDRWVVIEWLADSTDIHSWSELPSRKIRRPRVARKGKKR